MISILIIYLFAILLRVSMVTFAGPLNQEMEFGPFIMGLVAASYPIGLCLGLLPSGLLIKKWGVKHTLILSLLVMSFGIAMYGFAASVTGLFFGRLLIGISGSAAILAGLKALIQKKEGAAYGGLALAFGAIGGLLATWPTFELIMSYGWRTSCLIFALIGLVLIGVLSLTLKGEKASKKGLKAPYLEGVKEALSTRLFWGRALFPAAIFGGYVAFQTYWMAPYLSDIMKMSPSASSVLAAALNMGAFIALLFGSIKVIRKGLSRSLFIQVGSLIALALLYTLSKSSSILLWGAYGLFAQSACFVFGYFKKAAGESKYGYYSIATLLLTFAFAAIFQLAVGWILSSDAIAYTFAYNVICTASAAALIIGAIIALTTPKPKKPSIVKKPAAKKKRKQLAAR